MSADCDTCPCHSQYNLQVRVIAGRNLAAKDLNGKSDPYVIATLVNTGETQETRSIPKDLNPEWGQKFEYHVPKSLKFKDLILNLTVWDKDSWSKDDFMGFVQIKDFSKERKAWFKLGHSPKHKKDKISGDIQLQIRKVSCHHNRDTIYNLLDVYPISGQNLGKKGTVPQLNLWIKGFNVTTYQTPPPEKPDNNPNWPKLVDNPNYKYTFVLGEEDEEYENMVFQANVYAFKKTGGGPFLGECSQPLSVLPFDQPTKMLKPLSDSARFPKKLKHFEGAKVLFKFVLRKGKHPDWGNSALSQHVRFFDWNNDGVITEDEVKRACLQMGFSPFISWILSKTILPLLPTDLVSQLETGTRHPDAKVWTLDDGTFDEQKFEDWFYQSDTDHSGGLSTWEIMKACWKISKNPIVWIANMGEIQSVHLLMAQDGQLSKEHLKSFLTGDFFLALVAARRRELCLGYENSHKHEIKRKSTQNLFLESKNTSSSSSSSSSSTASSSSNNQIILDDDDIPTPRNSMTSISLLKNPDLPGGVSDVEYMSHLRVIA